MSEETNKSFFPCVLQIYTITQTNQKLSKKSTERGLLIICA